jgi:hypothetical protein
VGSLALAGGPSHPGHSLPLRRGRSEDGDRLLRLRALGHGDGGNPPSPDLEGQLRATVPVREYRPGYLLFFSESRREVDHVAIYIGRGYMLHASGKWGRVVVEPVIHYAPILVAIGALRTLPAQR